MGYRRMKEGLWGKPIGHSILIYRFKEKALYLHTVGLKNKPIIWNSEDIDPEDEDFLDKLKNTEANFAIGSGMSYYQSHDLSFLSMEEIISGML